MGNCAGSKNTSIPIKPIGKENLSTKQNDHPTAVPIEQKITLEQAKNKRQVLKNSLMEKSSCPPRFYVHKINPFQKKIGK